MNNQQLKLDHELAVCNNFLSLYNNLNQKNISLIRMGDPNKNEPDCICDNDIAIELVGTYDNTYQAEKLRNHARGKQTNTKPQYLLSTPQNLEDAIAKKLQKLNNKNYDGFSGQLLLVCSLESPLLQDNDVKNFIEQYDPFSKDNFFERYFNEIWILWKSEIDFRYKIVMLE